MFLTLNAGSSSIRFALYDDAESLSLSLRGKLERIGLTDTTFTVNDSSGQLLHRQVIEKNAGSPSDIVLAWLEAQPSFGFIRAVGHRVVHGMRHSKPELITVDLLGELHRMTPFDPEHLPREIELIKALGKRHPHLPQIACFDTAFHRDMPQVARLLPIPRKYQALGVERYGFHGLSYSYLMEELVRLGDPAATHGRVILAHLGNGASLAAVRNGQSIDTSMSFTPASGLMMSTRSGDLDPNLIFYLAQTEQMTAAQFQHLVNHRSGLLGVSQISSDMRDLLRLEGTESHAAEAVTLFCYQVAKWIGAFAAVLGGVDTLVFAGGIGENAPVVRTRVCERLGFLGIELDASRNAATAAVISRDACRAIVRVIRTDEEMMIARSLQRFKELL